jgi:hypothetical protein
MRFVRAILAFVIAAALAALPVGASGVAFATSPQSMPSSMHMHMHMDMDTGTDMSMRDCCPDGKTGAPFQTDDGKHHLGFCCDSGTVALGDVRAVAFEFSRAPSKKISIPADQVLSFRGGSPPFRPPRV